jgi:cytidine deaminase
MSTISPELLRRLEQAARKAAGSSYSPYSGFPVGAAVLTEGDGIYSSCNIENASLGLSVCAERTAIWRVIADGRRQILALVLYTPTVTAVTPCGTCRQVLHEFGPSALVVGVCDTAERLETTLDALLPAPFDRRILPRKKEGPKG